MTEEPYCAVCDRTVPPDTDHVRVEVEKKRMCDRNDTDYYYLHMECALDELGDWSDPA
jgi:hypothetical protein